jgi:glycosyltransferase involved in cell wall biosynthesis
MLQHVEIVLKGKPEKVVTTCENSGTAPLLCLRQMCGRSERRMPRVSVIIPVYNPGEYLKLAVESVIAQTYTDWEIVLIDDGSPEDFSDVVTLHPAIRLLRQANQGQSIARNLGILNSSSDYIAFLDQDDLWHPAKLEKQMAYFAAHPEIGFCHTEFDLIDAEGAFVQKGFAEPIDGYEDLLRGCRMMNCTVVMKRNLFSNSGLLRDTYRGVQDYDQWLRVARYHTLGYLPECLASWRVHGNNFSKNFEVMYEENLKLMREHLGYARETGNHKAEEAIKYSINRFNISFGCGAFEQCRESFRKRDWKSFFPQYTRSLQRNPSFTISSTVAYAVGRRNKKAEPPVG